MDHNIIGQSGWIAINIAAAFLAALVALFQFAAYRAPEVVEFGWRRRARVVRFIGHLLGFFCLGIYPAIDGDGLIAPIQHPVLFAVIAWTVADLIAVLDRLFPERWGQYHR